MSPQMPLHNLTPTEFDLDNNNNHSTTTTTSSSSKKHQTLREKATQALHGPDANPSQLGDPISLKAETSNTIPTPAEVGASSSSSPTSSHSHSHSSSSSSSSSSTLPTRGREKLREKAARELHGPGANPSLLGDPISLKAEASDHVPTPSEEGSVAPRRAEWRSRI